MERKSIFVSIGTKITLMALVMVVVSVVFISVFSYYSYRSDSIKLQGDVALAVANSLVAAIDAKKFKEVASTKEQNDYFRQMRELFNTAKAKTGISYLYTMVKADDGINYRYIYVTMGSDDGELGVLERLTVMELLL